MDNSTLKEELAEIDSRIKLLKDNVELGEALERLHTNEDFQNVILSGYFEKESKRIFGLLVEPTSLKRDIILNLNDKLTSIRSFKQYFATVLINANMAPEQLTEEELFRTNFTADNALIEDVRQGDL